MLNPEWTDMILAQYQPVKIGMVGDKWFLNLGYGGVMELTDLVHTTTE